MAEKITIRVIERLGGGHANEGHDVAFGLKTEKNQEVVIVMEFGLFQAWLNDLHDYAQMAYDEIKKRDPAFDEAGSVKSVFSNQIESHLVGSTSDQENLVIQFQSTAKTTLAVSIPAEGVQKLLADIETEAQKLPMARKN